MKDIVIVGDGGFGKEVEWLIERINNEKPTWNVLGFIGPELNDPRVVGDDDYVINYDKELHVAIAIGRAEIRKKLYNAYKVNPSIRFANLIDPCVESSNRITMGEGNIICAGTILTVDITLGNCNIINLDCTVGHDAVIGDFVTVNPSVNISGGTVVGTGCNLGTGTQTVQYVKIGCNTVIGAGAVVNRDLPDNCTAVGVPAKVIKMN